MPDARYDYIIAGAGASGLSLAYHLVNAGLRDRRILLLDRAPKTQNDRTWCFWEAGDGPFEAAIFRRWDKIWFHGEDFGERLEIRPYAYKMLRGIDFYRFMGDWLSEQSNITVLYGEIGKIEEGGGGGRVGLESQPYEADWVFSSLPQPAPQRPGRHYLLQHFKGWVIEAAKPVFDPTAATFMDFRLEQRGETRFAYVLPFDEHRALVEYTLFSPELLKPEEYDAGLRQYISEHLGLSPEPRTLSTRVAGPQERLHPTPEPYTVLEQEFGIIPMTDAPFALRQSPHVMNIGTAGGRTKASTGYTFQRIQTQSRRIAESLLRTGQPFYPLPRFNRHELFDSVLLDVITHGRDTAKAAFTDLFRKNPPQRVLKFLDETTSLAEDLAIMSSVNTLAFGRGALEVARNRLFLR